MYLHVLSSKLFTWPTTVVGDLQQWSFTVKVPRMFCGWARYQARWISSFPQGEYLKHGGSVKAKQQADLLKTASRVVCSACMHGNPVVVRPATKRKGPNCFPQSTEPRTRIECPLLSTVGVGEEGAGPDSGCGLSDCDKMRRPSGPYLISA
jgi:hypothetical protein